MSKHKVIWEHHADLICQRLHEVKPKIHCITNYVTANQVANILLAGGASPIMADSAVEVQEVTTLSDALSLNIGTLNLERAQAMKLAFQKALELGKPIVIDPVGCASTQFRLKLVQDLMLLGIPTIIKGNASEIRAIALGQTLNTGIDSNASDDPLIEADLMNLGSALSQRLNSIIIITGKEDLVFKGSSIYRVKGGHDNLSNITGTGCMLNAIIAFYTALCPGRPLESALVALGHFKTCGQLAYEGAEVGLATYFQKFWDTFSLLTPSETKGGFIIEKIS